MQQRSCRAELAELWAAQGRSWLRLTRHRLQVGSTLRRRLDLMADRYPGLGDALPDPVMEDFRLMVRRHGSLIMRDALLDEIYPRINRRWVRRGTLDM